MGGAAHCKADFLSEQPCCLLLQPAMRYGLPLDCQTGPIAYLLPLSQFHKLKAAVSASAIQQVMVLSRVLPTVQELPFVLEPASTGLGPGFKPPHARTCKALDPARSRHAAPWLTCCLLLWSEVLHTVKVGEVDPALVGCGAVLIVLLHVQAVQADINSVQLLKQ